MRPRGTGPYSWDSAGWPRCLGLCSVNLALACDAAPGGVALTGGTRTPHGQLSPWGLGAGSLAHHPEKLRLRHLQLTFSQPGGHIGSHL